MQVSAIMLKNDILNTVTSFYHNKFKKYKHKQLQMNIE